jgi:hypothetical protein
MLCAQLLARVRNMLDVRRLLMLRRDATARAFELVWDNTRILLAVESRPDLRIGLKRLLRRRAVKSGTAREQEYQ